MAPILGTGSLKMHVNGGTLGRVNGVRSAGPTGFTSGRARFLARLNGFEGNTSLGFVFQQSQLNMAEFTGQGYWFRWFVGSNQTNHTLRIDRLTQGMAQSTVPIAVSPAFTWLPDTVMALECEWVLDLPQLGGILFTARRGTQSDFSDLQAVTGMDHVLSTQNILQTSVAEGPAWYAPGFQGWSYLWDAMSCTQLIVASD
ncbi:MAG: hypothetical protein EHM21_00145 [Chloroflexi bacterium]|nr:MAG: hypothetical protein EHM21_00145 [Chloroflexota bacterium]